MANGTTNRKARGSKGLRNLPVTASRADEIVGGGTATTTKPTTTDPKPYYTVTMNNCLISGYSL